MRLDDPDVARYLDSADPVYVAVLGSLRSDGSPHGVPVWFGRRGDELLVPGRPQALWVRNLERDPRVSITVQDHLDGHFVSEPGSGVSSRAVMMWGEATLESTPGDAVREQLLSVVKRYRSTEDARAYVDSDPDLRVLARIRPRAVRARL